jgi:hypothetical protein
VGEVCQEKVQNAEAVKNATQTLWNLTLAPRAALE